MRRHASRRPKNRRQRRLLAEGPNRGDADLLRGVVAPTCAVVREAISARFDGEESPLVDAVVERHVAACPGCFAFKSAMPMLKRRVNVRMLAVDRSAAPRISIEPADIRRERAERRTRAMRAAQLVAAALPLAFAVPTLVLGVFSHVHIVPAHVPGPCTILLSHHFRVG